ncbi:MAG: mercuric reductase [Leptospira sp.]|nr:mercuric reductase [Leptospira sp.]NCS92467.1 mercuric reductase [Leptospira sp.]
MKSYDVLLIGTGQATGVVIPKLVEAGKTVAIIESGKFGGTCVNYGCTPTKTLVASAHAAHVIRRSSDFGIDVGEFKVDFARVMDRMNSIRYTNSEKMHDWLSELSGVDIYKGEGKFIDEHTVQVDENETQIKAETIVIHTGTKARSLSIPGIENVPWLDNQKLLDLKELPKHLLIIGGSYIGLEFGQIFRRLGSEVSIFQTSASIMSKEDEDIAKLSKDFLQEEGIAIYENSKVKKVSLSKGQIELDCSIQDENKLISGSHLLIAIGRIPQSSSLDLDKAGIKTDTRGYVIVDEFLRTSRSHIYALGDINGKGAFTHTSVNDGEIFLDQYLQKGNRKVTDRTMIYAMFTDPPLGRIGMSEKEARKSGRNVLISTLPMSRISRAKEKSETKGMIKILVDADSDEFLGVTILGVGGDEIINIFAPLIQNKITYKEFRKTVLVHPTVSELLPWILDDLKPLELES